MSLEKPLTRYRMPFKARYKGAETANRSSATFNSTLLSDKVHKSHCFFS